jgi:3-deoxy-D-manno-octulosonic-acid transferase
MVGLKQNFQFWLDRQLSTKREARSYQSDVPRPPVHRLLWIEMAHVGHMSSVEVLTKQLAQLEDDICFLVTCRGEDDAIASDPNIIFAASPSEHPKAIQQFLDYWKPDLCMWVGSAFRHHLLFETHKRAIPLICIEYDAADHQQWSVKDRVILSSFSALFATSPEVTDLIADARADTKKILATTPALNQIHVPEFLEDDHAEVRAALASRPIWLATSVREDEIDLVLTSYATTVRYLHKLVLVLIPAEGQTDSLSNRMAEAGLQTCHWSDGVFPDQTTQVILCEDDADIGLWLRTADVTLLGSSLNSDGRGIDPVPAATLGTALMVGPFFGNHRDVYERLIAKNAIVQVTLVEDIRREICRLISPDVASTQAMAAWETITEGWDTTAKIAGAVRSLLTHKGDA